MQQTQHKITLATYLAIPVRAAGAKLHTPQDQAIQEPEKTTALIRREQSRLVTATKTSYSPEILKKAFTKKALT